MPCYHPISAWRCKTSGQVLFSDRGIGDALSLPCGRCIGCRLERSRQWATRIMFESQMHDANSFLTLTYSPESLPNPPSLFYPHFQLFMKRLRKDLGIPLRYFVCGEYGDQLSRPHYHACLFGYDFPDRTLFKVTGRGDRLYRSAVLERNWTYGHSSIGDLTFESAAYVARYNLKKVTGDQAKDHYQYLDQVTGEVHQLEPEFCRMSLKPGIGGHWFAKYSSDVFDGQDFIVINGHKCKPPRYFERLFKRQDRQAYEWMKDARTADPRSTTHETPERLAAREAVQLAAIGQLPPRNLDG